MPRPGKIYQLKITLKGSKPPIWRRVQAPSNLTLKQLHEVIQDAMGWGDSHLHEFTIFGESFRLPGADYHDPDDMFNEEKVRLRQLLEVGLSFLYVYDFGDDWEHRIVVEKSIPAEVGVHYPRCVAGKRACPPEDVGGIWGYQNFLEAISDPKHADHHRMQEWIGEPFDPEAFDLEAVNLRIHGGLDSVQIRIRI